MAHKKKRKQKEKTSPPRVKERVEKPRKAKERKIERGFLSRPFVPALIVFLFSFVLYANTISNEFVWDDRPLITENQFLKSLDGSTVHSIFFKNFWEKEARIGGYYRPLVLLSFNLNYKLFGLNPKGFHLANVTANAAACLVAFLLILALFRNKLLAFISALIFAALPLHTENVAWISGRTDVFATLWMFLSLTLYIVSRRKGRVFCLLLSLLCFTPALLFKEIAVVLPLMIVVIDYCFFGLPLGLGMRDSEANASSSFSRKTFSFPALYFFVLVCIYFILRHSASGTDILIYKPHAQGILKTTALIFSIISGYAFKLIFPFMLNAEYEAPIPESMLDFHALAGLIILATLFFGLYIGRRNRVYIIAASFFLFGIAPVLNIIPLAEVSAERFLYLPSLGFALVLGSIFASALDKRSSKIAIGSKGWLAILIVLMLAYSIRTIARNKDWKDEEALFTKTSQVAEENARAHVNMANVYIRKGSLREAIPELKKALEIDPNYIEALSNLAGVYKRLGYANLALPFIEKAIKLAPFDAKLHNDLGTICINLKKLDKAEKEFEKALQYNPLHYKARFNLALLKYNTGDKDAALRSFEEIKNLGKEFEMAYYYIGMIAADQGKSDYALHHLEYFLSTHITEDRYHKSAEEMVSKIRSSIEQPSG